MIFRYLVGTEEIDIVKEILDNNGIEYEFDGYDRFMISEENHSTFESLLDEEFIEYNLI